MTAEELNDYFAHIASTIDKKSMLSDHKILSFRECSAPGNAFSREHREGQRS
ncbi:hypothetical protein FGSG_12037 [Fusarium graminearum PH-1]|uniref:hypothetical protein n=1 Tax=Gibberella zeae (strain ATCC MYA-4620 / CBS 123657 / FGSC 9075 / NRRL 31084 / PH-1) TaxID=229533 RepID=UPI00021F1D04|nr:hypothetical protein FGSG_12037 [Fusarium graminearum PH-1]ESU07326.1 hypothetical protein FGSG_12037 [Fusarium graminearum PH-1]|eukprot:XP_011317811.1 hypothetical protein FGSG_12037 [Fusarium graminearum PH-1]